MGGSGKVGGEYANDGLIKGVVGWVDLTAPDVADRIAGLRAGPGGDRLVGVRHQVQDEPDPGWFARPEVLRGLRAVGAAGLVYDLLVLVPQLDVATDVVRQLPEVSFVQPRQDAMLMRQAQSNVLFTQTGQGSRSSEGDITHLAYAARSAFGANGTGIKIGVLSDGVTNLAASQASGDLGPVTVLPGHGPPTTIGAERTTNPFVQ